MMHTRSAAGFGLVDALVGMTLLSVGLLGICAAFAQGANSIAGSNYDILAREKAVEAIESVFSSRDTRTIPWAAIRNVNGETGSDGGVFLDGPQPLRLPGKDGLVNTQDDSNEIESIVRPGPDGQLGTDDDVRQPLADFRREIEIRTLNPTLRRIRVTIRYQVGAQERVYEVVTYISAYA